MMKDNVIYFPDVWQESMEELYEKMTLEELKKIAQIHEIAGLYKFRKSKQIAVIIDCILSHQYMWDFFLCASDEETDLFEQMMEDDQYMDEDDSYLKQLMRYFCRGGYILQNDQGKLMIPEEVKSAYRRLNTPEFQQAHKEYNTAYNYCCGLTALYGLASLREITRLYNAYEKKDMAPEEMLFDIFLPSLKRSRAITYTDDMLVEGILLHEEGLADSILKVRKSYDPYIPTKEEVYDLSHGIEDPLMIFGMYLMEYMRFSVQTAMGVTELVAGMLKIGADPEDVFELLKREDVAFINEEQADEFAGELVELWMNLRLYTLYGHTPLEMEKGAF